MMHFGQTFSRLFWVSGRYGICALDTSDDAAILDAMAAHPILIERAIVMTDKGAVIARPPEKARDVL